MAAAVRLLGLESYNNNLRVFSVETVKSGHPLSATFTPGLHVKVCIPNSSMSTLKS